MMAWLVVLQVTVVSLSVGYSALTQQDNTIAVLSESWQMLTASMGIPTAVLLQYFGKRTKEKLERYNLAMGKEKTLISDAVKMMFKK